MKASSKYTNLIFIIFTLIQAIIIIFWGTQKENLYWDEFYTLERAHYISDSTPGDHWIDDDPEYKIGKWLPVSMIQDTLVVTKEESVLADSFLHTIKKMVKSYNYSILLNVFSVIISPGKLSIWPSIILNIVLFIINQMILFAFCNRLFSNQYYALFATSFYGFTSMCVSMATYVRFYMFATMLTTLFTFFTCLYYSTKDEEHVKRIMYLALDALTLYIAYGNAQYVIIYAGFLGIVLAVLIKIRQGWKRFLLFAVPVLGVGLTYIGLKTPYLKIFYDFEEVYSDSNDALTATLDQIVEFDIRYVPERILEMGHNFGYYLFGSYFVMIGFLVLFIVMAAIHKISGKNTAERKSDSFIWVIVFSLLIYFVFFTALKLYEQIRYVSYVFPMLSVVLAAAVFNTFRDIKKNYILALVLILTVILSVNLKAKVDFLYTGDRYNIEKARALDADSMIVYANTHTTMITYQSALMVGHDAEYYVYSSLEDNAIENLRADLRDRMLMITYAGTDQDDVFQLLDEEGYSVEQIGGTYQYSLFDIKR